MEALIDALEWFRTNHAHSSNPDHQEYLKEGYQQLADHLDCNKILKLS
jgi:hypothetical protein